MTRWIIHLDFRLLCSCLTLSKVKKNSLFGGVCQLKPFCLAGCLQFRVGVFGYCYYRHEERVSNREPNARIMFTFLKKSYSPFSSVSSISSVFVAFSEALC